MSRTSIVAILAGFGIMFSGEVTSEAMAFARVVQTADPYLLARYAKLNPTSPFAQQAIEVAAKCNTNWVGGGCNLPDYSETDSSAVDPSLNVPYGG